MNRGTHTYNFQCNLPAELPTSVEGNIGYIRYTARVVVDVPMAFDKDFKQGFTVIRPLNLNNNPEMRVSNIRKARIILKISELKILFLFSYFKRKVSLRQLMNLAVAVGCVAVVAYLYDRLKYQQKFQLQGIRLVNLSIWSFMFITKAAKKHTISPLS